MANYVNPLIDPSTFVEVIDEFKIELDALIKTTTEVNDLGKKVKKYKKEVVEGSLQSKGKEETIEGTGNKVIWKYKFYCLAIFRLNIDDYILYKEKLLRVKSFQDYDEWNVRELDLESVDISAYRDPYEYIKFINGEVII